MAQNLSAGVAGAPQRGQIMITLLVKLERGPTGYDAEHADLRGGGAYRGRSGVDQEDVRPAPDHPENATTTAEERLGSPAVVGAPGDGGGG
jgi:hypothetical protein